MACATTSFQRFRIKHGRLHEQDNKGIQTSHPKQTTSSATRDHSGAAGPLSGAVAGSAAGVVRRHHARRAVERPVGIRANGRSTGFRFGCRTCQGHANACSHTRSNTRAHPNTHAGAHTTAGSDQSGRTGIGLEGLSPVCRENKNRNRHLCLVLRGWRKVDLGGAAGWQRCSGLQGAGSHRLRRTFHLCQWRGRGTDIPGRSQPYPSLLWHTPDYREKARGGLDLRNQCHQRLGQLLAGNRMDGPAPVGALAGKNPPGHESARGGQEQGFGGGHLPHPRWQHLFPRFGHRPLHKRQDQFWLLVQGYRGGGSTWIPAAVRGTGPQ